ncbi:HemK Methylase of polypeptide chain release factors [Burkholderiaceae bacterium]
MKTIKDLLSNTPIDKSDARVLLGHLVEQHLGWPRSALVSKDQELLPKELVAQWHEFEQGRLHGQPVAYLIGKKGFHGIDLTVNSSVLIPRPETELLVDLAIVEIKQRIANVPQGSSLRVLDLGTGSGAISLAFAHALRDTNQSGAKIEVIGVDASSEAIKLARENAIRLHLNNRVQFFQSDWYQDIPTELLGSFDLILSNPPYIPPSDTHLHQGDLRFEPRIALTDEHDGLQCIRLILARCHDFLKNEGLIAIEHGYDQAEQVRTLMNQVGLFNTESRPDLAGHLRISIGQKSPKTPLANRS